MRDILIAFGTTDGHTATIAAFLGSVLRDAGSRVEVIRVGVAGANPDPENYGAVIVAGSLHAGDTSGRCGDGCGAMQPR